MTWNQASEDIHQLGSSFRHRTSTLKRYVIRKSRRTGDQLGQSAQGQSVQSTHPDEIEKSRLRETLHNMFCDLGDLSVSALVKADLTRLGIRVGELPTTETVAENETSNNPSGPAQFFEPMSEAKIRSYPFSRDDEETQRYISNMPRLLDMAASLGDDIGAADFFCTHLAWRFGVAIRENISGDGRSLQTMNDWVF